MATTRAQPADPEMTIELRTQVKAAARAQRISQVKLAGLVGISAKHMSQLLLGRVDGRLGLWIQIATALGCELVVEDLPEGGSDS